MPPFLNLSATPPASLLSVMDARGITATRKKWGRFLPHQRANVDQVPLPFVTDMEETLEAKGADRICINQNRPSLGKRQATAQVCFRPVS